MTRSRVQRLPAGRAAGPGPAKSAGSRAPADHPLLRVQGTHGNRHVQRLVDRSAGGGLRVGATDDRFEREADRMAGEVAGGCPRHRHAVPHVQRAGDGTGASGGTLDAATSAAIGRARTGGRPVPDRIRGRMENATGADLGAVRVHADARAGRLANALHSRAFTVGTDVFVRPDLYRPGTAAGDALLAHELVHTVQQSGAPPGVQRKFGFELELAVPLTSGPAANLQQPYPRREDSGYPKLGKARDGSFEAHIDHSASMNNLVPEAARHRKQGALVELVTRPMDEFDETEADVQATMQQLVSFADELKRDALDANGGEGDRVLLDGLSNFKAKPTNVNYAGVREPNQIRRRAMSVQAYVQQTYGMSVRRVPPGVR